MAFSSQKLLPGIVPSPRVASLQPFASLEISVDPVNKHFTVSFNFENLEEFYIQRLLRMKLKSCQKLMNQVN